MNKLKLLEMAEDLKTASEYLKQLSIDMKDICMKLYDVAEELPPRNRKPTPWPGEGEM